MSVAELTPELHDDEIPYAGTKAFKQYYTKEEFNNEFPEVLFFVINNQKLVDEIKIFSDLIDCLAGEALRTKRDKFKVEEIYLQMDGSQPLYILTEAGERADNFEDLWLGVVSDIPGRGMVDACYANQETPAGRKNLVELMTFLAEKQTEGRALHQGIHDALGWESEMKVFVPGREEPSLIDMNAHVEFIGNVAVLVASNVLAEQYIFDPELDVYCYSSLRADAVSDYIENLIATIEEKGLESISYERYEAIKEAYSEKLNEAILDSVLGNNGKPRPQRVRKTPQPSP